MTSSKEQPRRPLITIDEAASILGTSERHMRRLIAERRISYVKVGHLVRFHPVEIESWIEAHAVPAVSETTWQSEARFSPRTGGAARYR
jgi:excisionase family DNA binding protein